MATFTEYAERVVGLTPRQTEERLRVATALEGLPRAATALAEGRVHFTAMRELTRVLAPDTEAEWLVAADGRSVGEIEEMVSGRRVGDRPSDPARAEARRHRIVLEVSAETFAIYREAQAKMHQDGLTEEEGVTRMARAVLGGPADPGRSNYQIHITRCDACGRATQDARGRAVVVEEAIAEMAECDAQRVDDAGRATQDITPATRRLVVRRQHGKCAVPGCRAAVFTDVHHLRLRSEGGSHNAENLVLLCEAHHAAAHRGAIVVDGSWSAGLTFRHADGSAYGAPARPSAAAILSDVHVALTGMGFKDREARWMVGQVRPHMGGDGKVGLVEAIRRALGAWRERAAAA
ncbi:MAG TPA: HNH endonuclease signature motif containing protein [Haliangiales bacterium]|nr:HNH endonuclease signature motif containing protein [Haliangiales bacterium]